jgi:hypothetical protein
MSEPNQIVFRVGGAACQEVIAWQQEIDQQVIHHQLERNGKGLLLAVSTPCSSLEGKGACL